MRATAGNRPTPRSTRSRRAVLCGAVLAAAALAAVLLYLGLRSSRDRQDLAERLLEADDALSLGYPDRAESRIRAAAGAARSESDWLRVQKRALQLARRTGDFRPMSELSSRAVERIGGSVRLRLLATYALLRAEEVQRAERLLGKKGQGAAFRSEPLSATLRAETVLKGELGEGAEEGLPEDIRSLLAAERIRDPSALAAVGRRFSEPRIALDASLLAMRLGRAREAFELLRDPAPAQLEPAFLIAYDAGEYGEALERLQGLRMAAGTAGEADGARKTAVPREAGAGRQDLQAMLGDLLVLTGDRAGAAEVYLFLVREDPTFSWKPFLSLASVLERGGDLESARLYRRRAIDTFPEERQVLLGLIRDLRARGETEELQRWTEEYMRRYPDDLETGLLRLEGESRRPGAAAGFAAYQARLWGLFHRFPTDTRLCRLVTLQLLSAGDLEGARAALKLYEDAAGEGKAPWQYPLRGIIEALEGRPEAAVGQFTSALNRGEDWRLHVNRGLALGAAGEWRAAMEDLRRAEAGLRALRLRAGAPGIAADSPLFSRIRTRMALLHLKLGDPEAARRELRYARELDPSNLQAGLLLRKLDEGSEK